MKKPNELDPSKKAVHLEDFEKDLSHQIIGQKEAVNAVVETYQTFSAGLNPKNRTVANLLFLGPTGTGKTHIVEAAAKSLFGDERAVLKIDCGEFQHSHEIAKIVGSPPGYLGHRETHPLFTQERINQWHTDKLKLTFVLIDEIEKASDALWQLLLGIMDKAVVTLGDCRQVDMSNCVIVMTSNLGSAEMNALINGKMGFAGLSSDKILGSKIKNVAIEAAKRKFSPEFMNRIDSTVVFNTLTKEQLREVLEIELGKFQQRIVQSSSMAQFVFNCSSEVKDFLVTEGYDPHYNARHLKRSVEKHLVRPFARMIASEQLKLGDFVSVELEDGELKFYKKAEGILIPVALAALKIDARGDTKEGKLGGKGRELNTYLDRVISESKHRDAASDSNKQAKTKHARTKQQRQSYYPYNTWPPVTWPPIR